MSKNNIPKLTLSAFFTAVIFLFAQLTIVTPAVPLTLQTLGVALCGFVLGVKYSTACVTAYILLGALGLPVFSAFKGGFHLLFGPTGGFILGFTVLSLACALTEKTAKKTLIILFPLLGVIILHIMGIFQYSLTTGNSAVASFATVSLPFILKDILCVYSAFFLSKILKSRLKGYDI